MNFIGQTNRKPLLFHYSQNTRGGSVLRFQAKNDPTTQKDLPSKRTGTPWFRIAALALSASVLPLAGITAYLSKSSKSPNVAHSEQSTVPGPTPESLRQELREAGALGRLVVPMGALENKGFEANIAGVMAVLKTEAIDKPEKDQLSEETLRLVSIAAARVAGGLKSCEYLLVKNGDTKEYPAIYRAGQTCNGPELQQEPILKAAQEGTVNAVEVTFHSNRSSTVDIKLYGNFNE